MHKSFSFYLEENRMAEEQADMKYISLQGYMRNTPSDTEVHAEHQLRVGQEYLSRGKECIEPRKTQ